MLPAAPPPVSCDCEPGTPFPVIIVDVVARDRAQPLLSFPWRVCMPRVLRGKRVPIETPAPMHSSLPACSHEDFLNRQTWSSCRTCMGDRGVGGWPRAAPNWSLKLRFPIHCACNLCDEPTGHRAGASCNQLRRHHDRVSSPLYYVRFSSAVTEFPTSWDVCAWVGPWGGAQKL